jgi:hypothetical protein
MRPFHPSTKLASWLPCLLLAAASSSQRGTRTWSHLVEDLLVWPSHHDYFYHQLMRLDRPTNSPKRQVPGTTALSAACQGPLTSLSPRLVRLPSPLANTSSNYFALLPCAAISIATSLDTYTQGHREYSLDLLCLPGGV